MKKRINLFSKKKRYDFITVYASHIRLYGSICGGLLLALFIYLLVLLVKTTQGIQSETSKKQQYLTYLIGEKDTEANIRYFKGKHTQLNTYLKDDANFLPYYSILQSSLQNASEAATLDNVSIDQNRNTQFVVKFQTFASMESFLKYIESEEFLKYFTDISLSNLSLTRDTIAHNYELQFKGKFKEINE